MKVKKSESLENLDRSPKLDSSHLLVAKQTKHCKGNLNFQKEERAAV